MTSPEPRTGPCGFGDPGFTANICPADNCPLAPNVVQADDDGIGDACDPCTDADGDGFGNPGPTNAAQRLSLSLVACKSHLEESP